ncbi:unnamed protein product [Durusdinium trenchii]|uniref:Uncharacterized protein n=1 Tax=Durusdinium trenchii TaxID=1381693 RepID=A0ABP0JZ87_9DINO
MSTSGWSFMDEGLVQLPDQEPSPQPGSKDSQHSPHFKATSSEMQQGSTRADQGPLSTPLPTTPLLRPHPDFLEELSEASSGSSSVSSCKLAPTVHVPSGQWISLSHPNAKLMLGLLGGRAEDQWDI